MFCTNCGTSISDDAKFCPNCGAVNQRAAQAAQPAPTQPAAAPVQPVQPEPTPQPVEAAPVQPAQANQAPQPVYAAAPAQQQAMSQNGPAYSAEMYPGYGAAAAAAPVKKKKTGLIVGICAGGAVVIAGIVVLILWLTGVFGGGVAGGVGGNSPVAVANSFIDIVMDPNGIDGQKVMDLLPDEMIDYAMSGGNYANEAEMADALEYSLGNSMVENLQLMGEYGISYDVSVGEAAPVSDYELEDIQDAYQEIGVNVSDAQTVEAVFNFEMDGETYSESTDIATIQVGGQWYLDTYSMG